MTSATDRHPYEQRITGDGSDWGEIMTDAFDSLMSSASESCTPDEMRVFESHIATTLGRPAFDANLEQALSFMRIWISDDAHLGDSELSAAFEKAEGLRKLDAIESAIAATLGGGTLTAEQVREAIERHSAWVIGNNRCFHDGAYEAIADELNAKLGSGTCENTQHDADFMCSVCGKCVDNGRILGFNYCPNCGKGVKR